MKRIATLFSVITLATASSMAFAFDASQVPEKKQTKAGMYMSAAEAMDHLKANANKTLFVDVRTRAEVNFLGTADVIDANVPYMEMSEWYSWDDKKNNFNLDVNSNFAKGVEDRLRGKGLSKDDTVILMCRSGDRSAKAANLLSDLGYKNVVSVVDGYEGDMAKDGPNKGRRAVNGWKNSNLPWSYDLDKTKMYVQK